MARAQQDLIEAHKHLSFTESSVAELTQARQIMQEDNRNLKDDLETSTVVYNLISLPQCDEIFRFHTASMIKQVETC